MPAEVKKVYVFIDDLDRCEVPRAADLMQAINLLIGESSRLVFILGLDREKVAAGIAVKFEDVIPYIYDLGQEKNDGAETQRRQAGIRFGYEFIEKFIQLPFQVPRLEVDNLDAFLEDLTRARATTLGSATESSQASSSRSANHPLWWVRLTARLLAPLFPKRRKRFQDAWHTKGEQAPESDDDTESWNRFELQVGSESAEVREIVKMVSPALGNNPRRLIQFINVFRLRAYTAYRTRLFNPKDPATEPLRLEQLGKFVALSLRWPLLLAELGEDPPLLRRLSVYAEETVHRLTKTPLDVEPPTSWQECVPLIELLASGANPKVDVDAYARNTLRSLDVERLLRVSAGTTPRSPRPPAPPADPGREPPSTQPPAPSPVEPSPEPPGGMEALKVKLQLTIESGDRKAEVQALVELAVAHEKVDLYAQAIEFYERSLPIHSEIGDRRGLGNTLGNLGVAHGRLGQVEEAIGNYERQLEIVREIGDRRGEGGALGNMGLAYAHLGRMEQAIECHQQALVISRESGDQRHEASVLANLGSAVASLGRVEEAIGHYKQALEISREIGDRRVEGNALGSLGHALAGLGKVEEAIGYYEQALEISREIGDRRVEGNALGSLGSAFATLGQVEEAIGYYKQALPISREIGDRRVEGAALGNLGKAYADLEQVEKAIACYEQALQIGEEIKDPQIIGPARENLKRLRAAR